MVLTDVFQVCALHFSMLIGRGNIISHCNGLNFHFHFPPFSCVHMKFSLPNISSPLLSFLTISVYRDVAHFGKEVS